MKNMADRKDYYKILGVNKDASQDDIKKDNISDTWNDNVSELVPTVGTVNLSCFINFRVNRLNRP